MAETHQKVVKVWIAPGCIVCDACETECPEVFDVQEETCVIRPEAVKAEFTRPLTPSIIAAAEGCPVEVIKFETVEADGPAPWAGKEKDQTRTSPTGAAGSDVHGKSRSPQQPVLTGPPAPRWAGLLEHTRATGGGKFPVEGNGDRPHARIPAQAIAQALPKFAPPDAVTSTMLATGYARLRPGAVEYIRRGATVATAAMSRRQFAVALAVAWGSLVAAGAVLAGALQSFMVPKVTKEPPSVFRAGRLGDYPAPGVYEQFKASQQVWIARLPDNRLVALSTICTHLGCIPNWLAGDQKFKCPCHGSGFYLTGVNFEGPAPRPLERYRIYLDGEVVMVDKSVKFRQELRQWNDPASFVRV